MPPVGIEVGWKAPSFLLETLDGRQVSLDDFAGSVVVVNFWATWCPFCVNEMPAFQKLHEEKGREVVILGINRAETEESQINFLKNELDIEVTYLLLIDPTDSVAKAYGIAVMPTTFFLDEDGVIARKRLGEMTLREMKILVEEAMKTERRDGGMKGLQEVDALRNLGGSHLEDVQIQEMNRVKHRHPDKTVVSIYQSPWQVP